MHGWQMIFSESETRGYVETVTNLSKSKSQKQSYNLPAGTTDNHLVLKDMGKPDYANQTTIFHVSKHHSSYPKWPPMTFSQGREQNPLLTHLTYSVLLCLTG